MDKTPRFEMSRLFLLERLPDFIDRADAHWQIYDNYLENTGLRLRRIRVPATREWTRILQKRTRADGARRQTAEIYLDEAEYKVFELFEGREIRKNRYFYEANDKHIVIDVFLGALTGLILAKAEFETTREMSEFEPPFTFVKEVTDEPAFDGANLVDKKNWKPRAEN